MAIFLGRINKMITDIFFWGCLYLCAFVLGANVKFEVIINEVINGENYINCVCLFLLVSIILFPVLFIIKWIRSGLTFFENFCISFEPAMLMPFWALNIKMLLHEKRTKTQKNIYKSDFRVFVHRLISMIVWWGIFGFVVYSVFTTNNGIKIAIDQFSFKDKIVRIVITFTVYVVLLIMSQVFFEILSRKWGKQVREGNRYRYNKNRGKRKEYYNQKYKKIPIGCSACGGPYPDCKTSCKLFDD